MNSCFRSPRNSFFGIVLLFLIQPALNGQQRDFTRVNLADSILNSGNNMFLDCSNWLRTPSWQSFASVGDLDVAGNQITVEAVFNRSAPYSGGYNWAGDLVSKHNDPSNVNYLLRPNNAEITTSNGFFMTPPICEIELNKTYHVALVYNGVTLKFYRNGFLMSSVAATGNLFQNNFLTKIGIYDATVNNTQFLGYINEVRIWNIARTQDQIRANMSSSLPSPTTQSGLLAYYTFDNLLNKQGNAAWNAVLGGAATINNINPGCSFNADSCALLAPCSQWLSTPTQGSKVLIGDLDIAGNQLTIEANFNRTQPLNNGLYYGSLVSKHTDQANANYSLLPNGCEITTTGSGYKAIFQACPLNLNETYHVAMVYNGSSLKYYRDGFLLSEIPCTGNIVNNDLSTTIGQIAGGADPSINQFLGYINEVRIWNIARSQADIRSYMNTVLSNPATQAGLVAYYTFNSLVNKQGNTSWNGQLAGAAAINQANPNCLFNPDSCAVPPCGTLDFNIRLDACNPLTVRFQGSGTSRLDPYWDFGDGNTSNLSLSPLTTYQAPGNYLISFSATNGACRDTVTKQVSLGLVPDNIIITPDTTLCPGASKQLRTLPSLSFCWTPTTYLDNANSPNPTTSTPRDITYYFTAEIAGNNLLTNGDFSQGNTGFASAYQYNSTSGTNPAVYNIGSSITAWHPGMVACSDHSSGTGNMMMVNGASQPAVNVWSQTVAVQPNTNYVFSCWLQHITTLNPAQLQFSINNMPVGPIFNANSTSCVWDQFYTTWNSGNASIATLSIINQNQGFSGNDFALDDLLFAPLFMKRDSVRITVDTPFVFTNADTTVCKGSSLQLTAGGGQTYSWSPAAGLNNPAISNPIASITANIQYVVAGTTARGCTAKDTVQINLHAVPPLTITGDTVICNNATLQLSASGGVSYAWTPAATLNNPSIADPVASPSATTRYYVIITDGNTCQHTDSVTVGIQPPPVFSVNNPAAVCEGDSIQLIASGGDSYSWLPATSLDNPSVPNPTAFPLVTTTYTVSVQESVCNSSGTVSTTITVNPLPLVEASRSNDIDCSNDRSQLLATGAEDYSWTPAATLDNGTVFNPVAMPVLTTQYTVRGTNADGCSNIDTVTVKVSTSNKGDYLMPGGFTPNNDGLNDCYGVKYWGVIGEIEFSIFNRWGERVFYSKERGKCWDGTYKGVKQDAGVFVYMIWAKTNCDTDVFRKGSFVLIR